MYGLVDDLERSENRRVEAFQESTRQRNAVALRLWRRAVPTRRRSRRGASRRAPVCRLRWLEAPTPCASAWAPPRSPRHSRRSRQGRGPSECGTVRPGPVPSLASGSTTHVSSASWDCVMARACKVPIAPAPTRTICTRVFGVMVVQSEKEPQVFAKPVRTGTVAGSIPGLVNRATHMAEHLAEPSRRSDRCLAPKQGMHRKREHLSRRLSRLRALAPPARAGDRGSTRTRGIGFG